MKRIALGLVWAAIGCGGEDSPARGGGVRVWHCGETRARELVRVGFPPNRNGVEFVIERAGSCLGGWAVVTTANASETEGAVSLVDLNTFSVREDFAPASPDAVARHIDGRLYILNRSGADSIRVYDSTRDFQSVGAEFSVADQGESAEPQDICCTSREECYVTRREDPEILIINPEAEAEGKVLGRIDLSSDVDPNPRPGACFLAGSRLAVALENAIAFVNLALDPPTVGSTLETAAPNPSGRFVAFSGTQALIAEVGEPGVADGVLELIDVAMSESVGTKLTEEALGGDLISITHCSSPQSYWAIAADASGHTALRSVDLATATDPGVARRPLFEADGDRLTGVSADACNKIWVTDRDLE